MGGAAEWLAEPASLEETQAWIEWASNQGMPCRVIGAGSNLLIHDDGLPGLSLCLRKLQGLQLDATRGPWRCSPANRSRHWQDALPALDCMVWSGRLASREPLAVRL